MAVRVVPSDVTFSDWESSKQSARRLLLCNDGAERISIVVQAPQTARFRIEDSGLRGARWLSAGEDLALCLEPSATVAVPIAFAAPLPSDPEFLLWDNFQDVVVVDSADARTPVTLRAFKRGSSASPDTLSPAVECLVHRPRPARAVFARLLADEPASSGALPAAPVPVLPLGEDAQAMASAQLVLSRSDASSRGAGPECSSGRCSEPASASRGGGTRDSARSARSSGSSISNVSALAVGDTLGDAGHHGASLTEQVHSRAEARAVVFMLRARLSTLRSTLPPADDPAAAQSAGAAHAMAGRRAGCEAPAATLSLSDWQQLQQRAKQAVAQGSRAEGASEAAFFASLVAGQRSCAPVDLAALQLCAAGDSGGSSSAQAPCALPTSASVPSRPVPPRPRSTRGGRAAVTVGQPNTTSTVAAAESAAIKIAAPAPASAPVATIATRQLPIAAARLASPPTAAPAPAPAPASVAKPPAVRAKAPTPAIASVAAAPALPASPATPSALSAGAARVASAQRLGHVAAAATESTADNASDADEEDEAAFYRRLVSASARPAPAATRKLRTTSVEQRLVGLDSETDSERDGGAPDADCDLGLSLSDGELAPASPPPAVHRHVKVKVTGAAKADTASRPRRQGRQ